MPISQVKLKGWWCLMCKSLITGSALVCIQSTSYTRSHMLQPWSSSGSAEKQETHCDIQLKPSLTFGCRHSHIEESHIEFARWTSSSPSSLPVWCLFSFSPYMFFLHPAIHFVLNFYRGLLQRPTPSDWININVQLASFSSKQLFFIENPAAGIVYNHEEKKKKQNN